MSVSYTSYSCWLCPTFGVQFRIMATYVNRQIYLQKLIHRRDNGEVKIITGTRRCGKSWLLKKVYHDYLVSQGVPKENIIMVSFDVDEDITGEDLTNPMVLKRYLYSKIIDEDASYYVFLAVGN